LNFEFVFTSFDEGVCGAYNLADYLYYVRDISGEDKSGYVDEQCALNNVGGDLFVMVKENIKEISFVILLSVSYLTGQFCPLGPGVVGCWSLWPLSV